MRRPRKVKRDKNGRWQKGTRSPNPKGRPRRKKSARPFDPTDIRDFMNQQVAMKDGVVKTRNELLHLKMFEDAMKGRVSNQRYLQKRYDDATAAVAQIAMEYAELVSNWIVNNKKLADLSYRIPEDVVRRMRRYHVLLHGENPEKYPDHMTPDVFIETLTMQHWLKKKRSEE
ncbi:MAG: hypothetical protein GC206_01755 [Alphaproteobacteria bacterium]|nr:hypothetical protein [Alphaproteobacteria bacterium]